MPKLVWSDSEQMKAQIAQQRRAHENYLLHPVRRLSQESTEPMRASLKQTNNWSVIRQAAVLLISALTDLTGHNSKLTL